MEFPKYLRALILIALSVLPQSAFAYNFLYIHPTTGEPIRWNNTETIQYWLDPGPFGELTNDQAHTLLKEAMKIWENASPYANTPKFEFAGLLPEDVNGTNYADYVSLFQCYTDDLDSCPSQAQKNLKTVIVFDEDGEILGEELCRIKACSANAGAKVFSGNSSDPGNIMQGIAVFGPNVLPFRYDEEGIADMVSYMVHELGHLLGLAHSVVNQEIYIEGSAEEFSNLPTMIFTAIGPDEISLNPDDIAGILVLYPSATAASEMATIKGRIFKSDSFPMTHVNVIVRNIDDPLCEAYSYLTARSCESDQEGCEALASDGDLTDPGFTISGLPFGSYTLEVEEVADDSLGQTLAPGLLPGEDIYGDAEFWNESDVANESNTISSVIILAAGETRENVDIILNRSEVTNDRIKYLPLDTFTPGHGSSCQPPSTNYAALIGIEDLVDSELPSGCSLIR